ncbi:MAG: outer membrane protein assembly factor BamA [Acidobacteriota bacterium]
MLFTLMTAAAQAPSPAAQPPADSPPLIRLVEIAFPTQGNISVVEPETYLYYIHTRPSRPSENVWVPFDPATPLEDFKRLWGTNFLDDLRVEVTDEPYANGVVGKHITFILEERQRVKIVDYTGSKAVDTLKIDEQLKAANAEIRLDTFIDAGLLRAVEGVVRNLLIEQGFQFASVTHAITEMPGGPKLVHVTFNMSEGPRVKIRTVTFSGNRTVDARVLRAQLKTNQQPPWWRPAFLGGTSTYQETKFDEDADLLQRYYRDRGYVTASIGVPEPRTLSDSPDGKTRWVDLHVPVTEGRRYRVGDFSIAGNVAVKADALTPLFMQKPGELYSEKKIRQGLEKAREIYGAGGYFEFTGYPDLNRRDRPVEGAIPEALAAVDDATGPSIVDVTMRLQEGRQFFVRRLAFEGNHTTHDAVIRREVALLEGGVFNTESLKYSVRRLNQLGYFKPIEDQKNIKVEKAPDVDDRVDVTLKVEEQNRNSLQFGAGISQYEGLFGNLSYTTTNLLGRGESLSLTAQQGSRAKIYQVGVTEPYLFDRPISASVSLYSNKYDYYSSNTSTLATTAKVSYSEVRQGSTWSMGRPFRRFMRGFIGYTYEIIDVNISDDLLSTTSSGAAAGTPLFNPYMDNGRHIDSRIAPSLVYNTVDSPITAHSGMRVTGTLQFASAALRGSYNYLKPELEVIKYFPTSRRTGFGLRGNAGLLRTYRDTTTVPYYLRFFLGGENQIRGTDIRTVGPLDSSNRALGGNRFVLFNAEYYLDLFSAVRLLAFHDAGQAFGEAERFSLSNLRTSSGGELRVFVPMLNVPFRLIYFVNIYRDTFQPYRGFKFAVGTTF